jgi:ATP-binding cassette subfamily C protein
VLFLLHPVYGWFGLGCAALLFLVSLATDLVTREPLAAASTAASNSVNDLAAVLHNTDLLDGMGMLPAVARRWQRRQNRTAFALDRASRHAKAFAALAKTLRLLMQGGVISVGVVLVIKGVASPGSMMGANLIIAKLLQPFEQLVSGWRQWVFSLAALHRVRDLLAHPRACGDAASPSQVSGAVEIRSLRFIPPGRDRAVLEDISLTIAPGEVLAIVGPSAAGKSTLARMIVGLFPPSAGSVCVDGIEATAWDRTAFGRVVGYVPQSVALLDGTIFDNIARMAEADPAAVVDAAHLAGVHEMIGRLPLGYGTWVGGKGYTLSGGQRQRIALARAVFGGPRLVVMDEPNASLDQAGEEDLARTILALKSRGTGVVVVTHRPALLAVVDTLLVLKQGRVQHYGARGEVLPRLGVPVAATTASSAPALAVAAP